MATLTPTLTLASSDLINGEDFNLSVTDSLDVVGQAFSFQIVASTTSTIFAAAANYTKSYVYIKNLSTTPNEIITIEEVAVDSTCDYNNDPTITMDSTALLTQGMSVSGTGIPADATVSSITNSTTFELSASTTGGSVTNGTLTFGTPEYMTLGAGEFAFFPWASTVDLASAAATGSPVLEVRIFQATAA